MRANPLRDGELYLSGSDRERVLTAYTDAVARARDPIGGEPETLSRLLSQAHAVITAVESMIARYVAGGPVEPDPPGSESGNEATESVTPERSITAATALFAAAHPVVAECLTRLDVESPALVAGELVQRAVMARVYATTSGYIGQLRGRIHRSGKDERRRIARDLHDLAAPAIALGLQNLEMYSVLRETNPDESEKRFHAVRDCLLDAVQTIHDLAAHSREPVGRHGLRHAVVQYAGTIPGPVRIDVTVRGDLDRIPRSYCDELYLIVREAMLNAVRHAAPTVVAVRLELTGNDLRIEIADDGCGFAVGELVDDGEHIGVFSMRERAELLGGDVRIDSVRGLGTRVRATVALPGYPARRSVVVQPESR